MSEREANTVVLASVAKGALAQIRHLTEHSDDRETARLIYCEMKNLTHKLAVKYRFPAEERKEAA